MKKVILILLCVFSIGAFAQSEQFQWKTDIEEARTASKDSSKPILIFFTNHQDSESIKALETNFFATPEFKVLSGKIVLLYADVSGRDNNISDVDNEKSQRLVAHYNKTKTFPSLITIDTNGKILGEHFTDISAASLTNYLSFLKTL